MRVAVVDIGTNSTRLLVADVTDGELSEVERRSIVTRLGRGVDTSGQLAGEAVEEVCRTVAEYIEAYEALGAERVNAIATSAVRDAANSGAFIAELRERFGLDARILGGSRGGGARLSRRLRRAAGGIRQHPGGRHRRRLHRAGGRLGGRGRLLHLASGGHRSPHGALPAHRPARPRGARGAGERRALADRRRADRRGDRHGQPRGSPSPARRPRWPRSTRSSTRTTPSAFTATRSPSTRSSAFTRCSPRRRSRSASRSPACIRAGRRRSSPGS